MATSWILLSQLKVMSKVLNELCCVFDHLLLESWEGEFSMVNVQLVSSSSWFLTVYPNTGLPETNGRPTRHKEPLFI